MLRTMQNKIDGRIGVIIKITQSLRLNRNIKILAFLAKYVFNTSDQVGLKSCLSWVLKVRPVGPGVSEQ